MGGDQAGTLRQASLGAPAASAEAGERSQFIEAVDDAIAPIEAAPEQYPVIHGRLRRGLLRRYPYAVYYKLYPSIISVVGVIHGHRHPDVWLRRAEP